jgi:hypothetical protein
VLGTEKTLSELPEKLNVCVRIIRTSKRLLRMTAGGKRMYVVLTSDGIAARGEAPVLPVYRDE